MPFNLLDAYLEYSSGWEVPRLYTTWSLIYTISAATRRMVRVEEGGLWIPMDMYVCLVGLAGNGKSVAKDTAFNFFTKALPDYPIGAARQTPADMIKQMALEENARFLTDYNGSLVEVHPMAYFINEMKTLLSIDIDGMIGFLTDIYHRKSFESSTIQRGKDVVRNPCLTFLSCQTTGWLIRNLKMEKIDSGIARRIILVHVPGHRKPEHSKPKLPSGHQVLQDKIISHLQTISKLRGVFQWTPESDRAWDTWYMTRKPPEDELMQAFWSTKPDTVLKVAMALALCEENPKLEFKPNHIEEAVKKVDELEPAMKKLTAAAGRNPLALPTEGVLERLRQHGGWMPENLAKQQARIDMDPLEIYSVFRYLEKDTQEIVVARWKFPTGVKKLMVFLKEKWISINKEDKATVGEPA